MRNLKRSVLLLSFGLLATACQIKPTQVKQTTATPEDPGSYAARVLREQPILLDVQSPIDYGLSHVPGAINTRWEDFTLPGAKIRGLLDPDRFGLARRLALWGINPETSVVIIGLGPEGHGEEGRLGWTLKLLGVKHIETGSLRVFRGQIPRDDEGRPDNKPIWKPEPRDDLELKPEEFQRLAFSKENFKIPTRARRKALQSQEFVSQPESRVILDVRHPNERHGPLMYDGKTLQWPVIELSWRDFYDELGRGKCSAVDLLTAQGVTMKSDILIIDEGGVGAAAVGFVLDSCGFARPRVLSSGLKAFQQ